MHHCNYTKLAKYLASLILVIPTVTYASAFATRDQSITYMGNAYAGTSSAVQDASTSYYNPAGLAYLNAKQVVGSLAYTNNHINLYDMSALDSAGDVIAGNDPTQPSASLLVPGLNLAYPINSGVSVGFSVVELFATDVKYDAMSMARFMATTTTLTTIDYSPSFGMKLCPDLYVGAAIDYMWTSMSLYSGVQWGTSALESNGYINNSKMAAWDLGYHIGILYLPHPCIRMGLVYFSNFSPKLSGTVSSARAINFGTPAPTTVTTYLNLPDRINGSITAEVSDRTTCMFEAEWTNWSRLKQMILTYNSTARPGLLVFQYRSTWRFSMGGEYVLNRCLTFKGGLCYDQTPVNNSYISIRVPESDRYSFGLGLVVNLHKKIRLVGGYSHTFMRTFYVTETAATESLNTSTLPDTPNQNFLSGKFNNSANAYGLQLVLTF